MPLASELSQLVFTRIYAENADRTDTIALYKDLLRGFWPGATTQSEWPDFEEVITILDEWGQYRSAYEWTHEREADLPGPWQKTCLLCSLAQLLCDQADAIPQDQCTLIECFVRHLVKGGHDVITFNWDLLLERAAQEIGVDVSYGGWQKSGIQVAKPHGSLNLIEVEQTGQLKLTVPFNLQQRLYRDWTDGSTDVGRFRNAKDTMISRGVDYDANPPLIVEPTARKQYTSKWVVLQWRRAFEMLRRSDEIVVIGFSLPPTDFRPRMLLQFAAQNRDSILRFLVVDPNASRVAERYRKYIPISIDPIDSSWLDWFGAQQA